MQCFLYLQVLFVHTKIRNNMKHKKIIRLYGQALDTVLHVFSFSLISTLLVFMLIHAFFYQASFTKYLGSIMQFSTQLFYVYCLSILIGLITRRYREIQYQEYNKQSMFLLVIVSMLFALLVRSFFNIPQNILIDVILFLLSYIFIVFALKDQFQYFVDVIVPFIRNIRFTVLRNGSISRINFIKYHVSILLLIFLMVSSFMFIHIRNINNKEALMKEFVIVSIDPAYGIANQRVTIEGYNFRWHDNEAYIINSTYGPIVSKDWQDTIVTFDVPLHLKDGPVDIWLERSVEESNTDHIIKSNVVSFEMLPWESYYPTEDESFYMRVIKKLRRVTLL